MRLVIYDNKPGPGLNNVFLRHTWQAWALKQRTLGECDAVLGANSWREAATWAASFPKVSSLQFWGHGSSGTAWCGGDWLRPAVFAPLAETMQANGYFWLRTCYSFRGDVGRNFAFGLTRVFGCTVVGHTQVIGIRQPGLQVLRAGEKPNWNDEDGASIWCFQNKWPGGELARAKNKEKA